MLPFLAKRKMAGLITEHRGHQTEVGGEVESNGNDSYAMRMLMTEFLHAIERKEPELMAKAFKEAFELCELQPHLESGTEISEE